MKTVLTIFFILLCQNISAREVNMYQDTDSYKKDGTLTTKEKQYEEKIAYLESELAKYKARLVEKSLYLEKTQDSLKMKYEQEITYLKREVIYKTKSLLDAQRQMEKMNPSEDMKALIRVNTEMAAQIRSAEDKMAQAQIRTEQEKGRAPASLKAK